MLVFLFKVFSSAGGLKDIKVFKVLKAPAKIFLTGNCLLIIAPTLLLCFLLLIIFNLSGHCNIRNFFNQCGALFI